MGKKVVFLVAVAIAVILARASSPLLAAEGPPERIAVDFPMLSISYYVPPPPGPPDARAPVLRRNGPILSISLGGVIVDEGGAWEVARADSRLYHFRPRQWENRYLEADLRQGRVIEVKKGTFGSIGGQGTPIGGARVQPVFAADNATLQVIVINLPSATFVCNLSTGAGRYSAAGIPLGETDREEWESAVAGERVRHLRHRGWPGFYWRIDGETMRITKVQEMSFGRKGGKGVPFVTGLRILPPEEKAAGGVEVEEDIGGTLAGPIPRSEWVETEKALYRGILRRRPHDVLVVPIQIQGYGIDRAGRSLMTRYLADRIARGTGLSVAPPTLVARALGETSRTFDEQDLRNLADELKARVIVRGYVGHDRRERMKLTVLVQERIGGSFRSSGMKTSVSNWADISFSDERPPSDAFLGMLDTVMASLPLKEKRKLEPPSAEKSASLSLPDTPALFVRDNSLPPAVLAYRLQWLGALAPEPTISRERYFERSLVALTRVSPRSPDYALLKARACFHLHRRPAAIAALRDPKTPEEKALAAILDGNLPEAERWTGEITQPIPRLLARIELEDLRWAYDMHLARPEEYGDATRDLPGWEWLVTRRLESGGGWDRGSNLEVKKWLDKAFPIAGYTAETLAGNASLFGESEMEIDIAFHLHLRKLLERPDDGLFDGENDGRLAQSDYLDLLVSHGESNLIHGLRISLDLRKIPQEAMDALDRWDIAFRGHPDMTALRAQALNALAAERPREFRERLLRTSAEQALNAFLWSGGQDPTSNSCRSYLDSRATGKRGNAYDGDWPKRPYWGIGSEPGDRLAFRRETLTGRNALSLTAAPVAGMKAGYETSLLYTQTSFHNYRMYYDQISRTAGPEVADAFLRANADRFIGHPQRIAFLAELAKRRGDEFEEEKLYEEATRSSPAVWSNYENLAKIRIERGDLRKAAAGLMRYPYFRSEAGGDRVAVSNYAFRMGAEFWWRGAVEEAIPFLKISVSSGTGSAAEMTSGDLLAILDGDYPGAVEWSLGLVRRYANPTGFRDGASLLHLMGYSREAWALFDAGTLKSNDPAVWLGAYVGHRVEKRTDDELLAWFVRRNIRDALQGHTAEKMLTFFLVDRPPDPAIAARIAKIEEEDHRARPIRTQSPPKKAGAAEFASAYQAMQSGKNEKAFDVFRSIAVPQYDGSFVNEVAVPYFAWTAMKCGKVAEAEKALAPWEKGSPFAWHLGRALLKGGRGDHEEAVRNLKKALNHIPYTKSRPLFPWYQLVEACEMLHADSGRAEYRRLALEWAGNHTRIQPMYGWAWAVVARYSDDPVGRLRALGMALHLDPRSFRIAGISETEKEKAREWMKKNDPFGKDRRTPISADI